MRGAIVVWLLAAAADGQELGLDLTDSTDYRPTLGIIGVGVVDNSLPRDIGDKLKVDKLSDAAEAAANRLNAYQGVIGPGDAYDKLAEGYSDALACADADCLRKVATRLDVNQLLLGQLVAKAGVPVLRIVSFTRFSNVLEMSELPAGTSAAALERKAAQAFEAALKKHSEVLAYIKVKSDTSGAMAKLGPHLLGPLPYEKPVPAGAFKLVVEAERYLPDEIDVELKVAETTEVEANLVPQTAGLPTEAEADASPVLGLDAERRKDPPGFYTRPGFILAAAGAAALAAGIYFGMSAKGIEGRAKDFNGDGALDITRREANGARTGATLANILVPVGAAAVAGGSVWLFITPTQRRLAEPSEAELAAVIGVGGTLP